MPLYLVFRYRGDGFELVTPKHSGSSNKHFLHEADNEEEAIRALEAMDAERFKVIEFAGGKDLKVVHPPRPAPEIVPIEDDVLEQLKQVFDGKE
jgi:hypothetical protein